MQLSALCLAINNVYICPGKSRMHGPKSMSNFSQEMILQLTLISLSLKPADHMLLTLHKLMKLTTGVKVKPKTDGWLAVSS